VGVIFHPRARKNGASGRATLLSGHHGLDDPDIDRLRAAIPRLAYIEGDAVAALSVTLVVLTNDRSQQRRGRAYLSPARPRDGGDGWHLRRSSRDRHHGLLRAAFNKR
jgi:hypothetical protein